MSRLNLVKDEGGNLTYLLNGIADVKYNNKVTAAGGVKTLTVPNAFPYYNAIFGYEAGVTVWVAINATAAAPTAGDFAACTSFPNPQGFKVKSGDVISFITEDVSAGVAVLLYDSNRA
jgi:hypothetical protein